MDLKSGIFGDLSRREFRILLTGICMGLLFMAPLPASLRILGAMFAAVLLATLVINQRARNAGQLPEDGHVVVNRD